MKYITPDLLVRFGSPDDEVASRASQEWEKAHAAYVAHLAAIGPQFPKPLRRLLKRFCLHDAKVLAMTLDEASSFSSYLELEKASRPEDKFLELKYRLVGPRGIHLTPHPELAGDGTALGWWQYDEVDTQQAQDDVLLFTHSILFTGGYELQLTFFNFAYRRLPFVHSTARDDDAAKVLQLLAG
jgi:hypothetical protein